MNFDLTTVYTSTKNSIHLRMSKEVWTDVDTNTGKSLSLCFISKYILTITLLQVRLVYCIIHITHITHYNIYLLSFIFYLVSFTFYTSPFTLDFFIYPYTVNDWAIKIEKNSQNFAS